MLENLFLRVAEISAACTVALLITVLLSDITEKKFSSKSRYLVWILIALRLIIPVSFSLPSAPLAIVAPSGDISLSYNIPASVSEDTSLADTGFSSQESTDSETEENNESAETAVTAVPEREAKVIIPFILVLSTVWICGVAVSVVITMVRYIQNKKRLCIWNRMPTDIVSEAFTDVCDEYGIKKIPVFLNRSIKSPMMLGFFSPCVLIPEMPQTYDEYKYVMRHEITHYIRKDVWYKLILTLACCVHWFNPFMTLLKEHAENDLEISCDENASANYTESERKEYCNTILKNIKNGKESEFFLSTGFHGGKDVILKRFDAVLSPKLKLGVRIIAVSLLSVLLCGMTVSFSLPSSYSKNFLFFITETDIRDENISPSDNIETDSAPEEQGERKTNNFPGENDIAEYNKKFEGLFETVTFGTYEQDNVLTNGTEEIEWLVLDKDNDGYYLLVSKYALDCHRYNDLCAEITWEEATIRDWMNSDFYNAAFSEKDKQLIKNGVSLLTLSQVQQYFPNTNSKIAFVTRYASAKCREMYRNVCAWYTIQEYEISHLSTIIDEDGSELIFGNSFDDDFTCFRPCIRVKL